MIKYYVYELWNPMTNQPFYVGYSKRSKRIYEHLHEAEIENVEFRKGTNIHKIYTIRKILKNGYDVDIRIVLETNDKNTAINTEIELIKKYGRRDLKTGILTNMTNGGEGCVSRVMTKQERKRCSERLKGKTFDELFGIERSIIIRNKIAKKKKGRKTNKPAWNYGLTKENNLSVKMISESKKGHIPYNKNKKMKDLNPSYINHFTGKHHSDTTKKQISLKNKGKCAGNKNGMFGRSAVKGRKWFHDGVKTYYLFPNDPDILDKGLTLGRLRPNTSMF